MPPLRNYRPGSTRLSGTSVALVRCRRGGRSAAIMTAFSVPRGDSSRGVQMSEEALDRLRGLLLAERDARCADIAENEAWLSTASSEVFEGEIRRLARAAIRRDRETIEEIDLTLERLVATYGSCEWCGSDIPAERLEALPPGRLCQSCKRRNRNPDFLIDLSSAGRATLRRRPRPCGRANAASK